MAQWPCGLREILEVHNMGLQPRHGRGQARRARPGTTRSTWMRTIEEQQ